MIIHGYRDAALASLGLSVIAPDRPGLSPSMPGYVVVSPWSADTTPPTPYYISVSPGGAQIDVSLGCSELVDHYELYYGPSSSPPLVTEGVTVTSLSGIFRLAILSGAGTYLHARTARGQFRSGWATWDGRAGDTSGDDEWVLTHSDDPLSGADGAAYPYIAEQGGTPCQIVTSSDGESSWIRPGYAGVAPYPAILGFITAPGCVHSEWGGKVEFGFYFRMYATEPVGVILCARQAASASWDSETFYVLFHTNSFDRSDHRLTLGKYTNGTYAQLQQSGNLHPAVFGELTDVNYLVSVWRQDSKFSVFVDGQLAWTTYDSSIPNDAGRIYTGIYLGWGFYGSDYTGCYITAHLRVWKRVFGAGGAIVDPGGIDHDDLSNVTADQHHRQAHDLTGADHALAGLTAGQPYRASSATAAGFGTIAQAVSHDSADTDAAATSIHHTLGAGASQAAAGNHSHALGGLSDTSITSPSGGDVLTYSAGGGVWISAAPTGGTSGGGGDLLSELANSEVAVTGAATATLGAMHVCSGTSADYTVALPAASGNAGKLIGFRMSSGLTKLVTLDGSGAETIDGSATRVMWAGESAILLCDGGGWTKIAGKSIPMRGVLVPSAADQTFGASTSTKLNYTVSNELAAPALFQDAANAKMVILRPGHYRLFGLGTCMWSNASQTLVAIMLYKGSSAISFGQLLCPPANVITVYAHWSGALAASDEVSLYGWYSAGSFVTAFLQTSGAANPALNRLEVCETVTW